VLILQSVIVVNMEGGDALADSGDCIGDAHRHVRVSQVKADAHVVEMAEIENCHEPLRCGGLAHQVLHEQVDAQRVCKRAQVLEGNNGVFNRPLRPAVRAFAQVAAQDS